VGQCRELLVGLSQPTRLSRPYMLLAWLSTMARTALRTLTDVCLCFRASAAMQPCSKHVRHSAKQDRVHRAYLSARTQAYAEVPHTQLTSPHLQTDKHQLPLPQVLPRPCCNHSPCTILLCCCCLPRKGEHTHILLVCCGRWPSCNANSLHSRHCQAPNVEACNSGSCDSTQKTHAQNHHPSVKGGAVCVWTHLLL
jgi:hypothetical protein